MDTAIVDVSLIAFVVMVISLMVSPEHRAAQTTHSTATAQPVAAAS
jgi:hypothetical protein